MFSADCALDQEGNIDPIVSPGVASAHLHDIFGSLGLTPSSTVESMRAAGTSCTNAGDTAAYWAPSLIGSNGASYMPTNVLAYYRAAPGVPVRAFPAGLAMVADQSDDPARSGYSCSADGPMSPVPVNCSSGYLKLHIAFPSWWDGQRLDSGDHRSHMSFDRDVQHPIPLPKLVIHVQYRGLTQAASLGYMPSSVLIDGTQAHADFLNAWQPGALERIVAECLNTGADCRKQV